MKTSHFIFTIFAMFLFTSCGQPKGQEKVAFTENQKLINSNTEIFANNNSELTHNIQQTNITAHNTSAQSEKKYVRMRDDATGMIMMRFPVPNSWNPSNTRPDVLLEGPNGIKIFKDVSNTFYYSENEEYKYFLKKQGHIIKAPLTHEDLFLKDYKSLAERAGNKLVTSYPLKAIADTESRIDAMYMKEDPATTLFHATVSEWEDKNGNPSMVVLKYYKSNHGNGLISWGYTISEMIADRAVFQQAKGDFLESLVQKQANPAYVAYMNQKTSQALKYKEELQRFNNNPEAELTTSGDWSKFETNEKKTQDSFDKQVDKQDQMHQDMINDIYNPEAAYKEEDSWEQLNATDDGWN